MYVYMYICIYVYMYICIYYRCNVQPFTVDSKRDSFILSRQKRITEKYAAPVEARCRSGAQAEPKQIQYNLINLTAFQFCQLTLQPLKC